MNEPLLGKIMVQRVEVPESKDFLELLTRISFLNLDSNKKYLLILTSQIRTDVAVGSQEKKQLTLKYLKLVKDRGRNFFNGCNFLGKLDEIRKEIIKLSNEEVSGIAKELVEEIENGNINIW